MHLGFCFTFSPIFSIILFDYSLLNIHNNICSFYMQNIKPLASLCSSAGQTESYLVANREDRFLKTWFI